MNSTKNIKFWCALLRTPKVGCTTFNKLLLKTTPEELFHISNKDLRHWGLHPLSIQSLQNPDWDNVDRDCVEQLSTVGTPTGPWTPLLNDCHDWVENTMNECDPDVQEQQAEELRRSDRLMQQILDDPTLW